MRGPAPELVVVDAEPDRVRPMRGAITRTGAEWPEPRKAGFVRISLALADDGGGNNPPERYEGH